VTHALYVLVVDDDREAADTLGVLVERCGHQAVVAYGEEEALRLSAIHPPDVAFLDLDLARLDDLRLARRLSEAPRPTPLVLVALTGQAGPGLHEQAYAAGFMFYLIKPVQPAELGRLLTTIAQVKADGLRRN
jgi:CheY-like chemotaxis protein